VFLETLLAHTKNPKETVLLIDGDLYLYRAAAASEEEIDWGNDVWSLMSDLKEAKRIFQGFIDDICESLDCGNFIVAFSDRDNFRHDIDPTYKGGRRKIRKPVGYRELVKWSKDTYRCHTEPLLEADDVLGICGSAPDFDVIMVSDDKDLKSIPGSLYRPMSGEFSVISKQQADKSFLKQALMGDITDGYGGCPGVGEKTAERILAKDPTWSAVVNEYSKKSLGHDHALVQARLARILRFEDWDDQKHQIKLWTPPQSPRGRVNNDKVA